MTKNELLERIQFLEKENKELKDLLAKAGVQTEEKMQSETDASSTPFLPVIDRQMARVFFSYFWGREDVFARRFVSKRTGKTGYSPQCVNLWSRGICPKVENNQYPCAKCSNRKYTPLKVEDITAHIEGQKEDGSDVIGIYPLYPNGTCRFLVFDFDSHTDLNDDWKNEVDALRTICHSLHVPILVERSRSGQGAHVWVFFDKPVSARKARHFAFRVLQKGAETVSLTSFRYYDRIIPTQDELPKGGLGNLIALPLQGQALKSGNSCFVDEHWDAIPDQWNALRQTRKLSEAELDRLFEEWAEDTHSAETDASPWESQKPFSKSDARNPIQIVLADRVYVSTEYIAPRLQNQLRRLAAVSNPKYFQNVRMKYSNFNTPRYVYLGEDVEGYIALPRGLFPKLEKGFQQAGIHFRVEDKRSTGRAIDVSFLGELRPEQKKAADALLAEDTGVLWAAPGFGKTVVGSYLIAGLKCSTLIILENSSLMEQWQSSFARFLEIHEPNPVYFTKTGRKKTRNSVIGEIRGVKDTSNGIIDIAMAGSLFPEGKPHPRLKEYGLVIVDESHHTASETVTKVLQVVSAKNVYGVTATKDRSDGLQPVNEMLLGPVRFRYTSKSQAEAQSFPHYVYPRFTHVVTPYGLQDKHINAFYELLRDSDQRNQQIVKDIEECIANKRTPVVLTRYTEHARLLASQLESVADHLFLMVGALGKKRLQEVRAEMESVPDHETLILVATGKLLGEGFDFPRLDTLIMATPVSWKGIVEQYAGRLNREHAGKESVVIYDYVDTHIPVFSAMYAKRLKAYRQIGYTVTSESVPTPQVGNAIFDVDTYRSTYEKDLQAAQKRIIISSPELRRGKIELFLRTVQAAQENGVDILVVTLHPDACHYGKAETRFSLLEQLRNVGVTVKLHYELYERFTIVDDSLVWYGSLNYLGKEDQDDVVMRLQSTAIAEELLELTFRESAKLSSFPEI